MKHSSLEKIRGIGPEKAKALLSYFGEYAAIKNADAEELLRASRLVAEAMGFTCVHEDHVPAWAVNPHSKLVPLACEVYAEVTGDKMVVEPVHGGLECGAFFEKNPHLDMIAIGPSLTDVHSPNEACDIESVRVTAELVIEILERLA